MTALVLAAVLAMDGGVPVDAGGLRFSDGLYATCPAAPEPAVQLDGGWFLPDARAQRVACLMATCETARREEKAIVEEPPNWWLVASAAVVAGVAAGIGLGVAIERARH